MKCATDSVLRDQLAHVLCDLDLPDSVIGPAIGLDRRRLARARVQIEPSRRVGERYWTSVEEQFVSDWIVAQCTPLNNQSKTASIRVGGERIYSQVYQDFIGKKELYNQFQFEYPDFRSMSQTKFNNLVPWFVRSGVAEECVCHLHFALSTLLDEYRRLAPTFHRDFADTGIVNASHIECQKCLTHPLATAVHGDPIKTVRPVMSLSSVIQHTVCAGACSPESPQRLCCGLLEDRESRCGKCGWESLVPRCPAEWASTIQYQWRQVDKVCGCHCIELCLPILHTVMYRSSLRRRREMTDRICHPINSGDSVRVHDAACVNLQPGFATPFPGYLASLCSTRDSQNNANVPCPLCYRLHHEVNFFSLVLHLMCADSS